MDPDFSPNQVRASYITTVPRDVICRIALDTISSYPHPPPPHELHTLSQLHSVCRLLHNSLSITKNHSFYATVFQRMFDTGAVDKRLGSRATAPRVLTLELQNRTKVLRRIRMSTTCDDITPGDQNAIFFMLLDNEGKNMQQLQYAGVARFLELGITCALADSLSSPSLSPPPGLLWPLVWMTGTLRFIIERNLRQREDMLNALMPFLLLQERLRISDAILAHDDPPPITPVPFNHHGVTLTPTPPRLQPFARLCAAELFHAINPNITINAIESRTYNDEWRQSTCVDAQKSDANCAATTFDGYGKDPSSTVTGDRGSQRQETCEVVTQCRLREYHAVVVEDTLTWDGAADNGDPLSRAWFLVGVRWYEMEDTLMIYDPTKSRWLQYHSNAYFIRTDTLPAARDTIIIGTMFPMRTYTLHGRVRRSDGHIALVRTPTNLAHAFLGTWVFHGRVYGGTDFVGDWRSTATEARVTAMGWFAWVKVGRL